MIRNDVDKVLGENPGAMNVTRKELLELYLYLGIGILGASIIIFFDIRCGGCLA